MTEINFQTLIDYLETIYPPSIAEEWDNIGLHFGKRKQPIHKLMTALDARPATIQEAIEKKVDTLVVHHPPLYNSIKRFDFEQHPIQMYADIIKNDLNIYAMHTNVDRAKGGMNDWLAEALSLTAIRPYRDSDEAKEVSVARLGQLEKPMTQAELIQHVKTAFHLEQVILIEEEAKPQYQTVMLVGGAGFSFINEVLDAQPDVYITGDVTFHDAQEYYEQKMTVIDAGHYIEHIFNEKMAEILQQWATKNGYPLEIIPSQVSTNPYRIK